MGTWEGTICDETGCEREAQFLAFAAYPDHATNAQPGGNVHPAVRRYVFPMIRACADHLTTRIDRDQAAQCAMPLYVLRPIGKEVK